MSPSRQRPPFSPEVAAILRDADRKIRARSGSRHALYNYWRVTMGKICQVDAFYIGFFRGDRTIAYPYNYDGQEYVHPDVHTYGDNGMAAWILTHRRPYTFGLDDGRLLGQGVSFGDETRCSADAVVVPIMWDTAGSPVVIGLASIQSYTPGSYTDEHVRAFQWTSRSVATVLAREQEDELNRRSLGPAPDAFDATPTSMVEMVDDVCARLRSLTRLIDGLAETIPPSAAEARARAAHLKESCERIQTEVMDMIARPALEADDLLQTLTRREREIALLIADGFGNDGIAERLSISEATVKTHASRIFAKLGVRQRAAVAAKIRPLR